MAQQGETQQITIKYGISKDNLVMMEFSAPAQLNVMTVAQAKAMVTQLNEAIQLAEDRIAGRIA